MLFVVVVATIAPLFHNHVVSSITTAAAVSVIGAAHTEVTVLGLECHDHWTATTTAIADMADIATR